MAHKAEILEAATQATGGQRGRVPWHFPPRTEALWRDACDGFGCRDAFVYRKVKICADRWEVNRALLEIEALQMSLVELGDQQSISACNRYSV
jgi:hypothetical protein